jgi:hypothetical protein
VLLGVFRFRPSSALSTRGEAADVDEHHRDGLAAPLRAAAAARIGVVVFPGSGTSANLADKARKMGIPVRRFTEDGAA